MDISSNRAFVFLYIGGLYPSPGSKIPMVANANPRHGIADQNGNKSRYLSGLVAIVIDIPQVRTTQRVCAGFPQYLLKRNSSIIIITVVSFFGTHLFSCIFSRYFRTILRNLRVITKFIVGSHFPAPQLC